MPKENNKMQVDIDTLKKQNVNDLLSIKELYSKLEELGEKITQVKYIDNTLVKKIKKEYGNLKKIILDENVQVQLDNKINEFNLKLTHNIETINSQMDSKANKNDLAFVNVKDFGALGDGVTDDTESIQNAINYVRENKGGTVLIPSTKNFYKITGNLYIKGFVGSDSTSISIKGEEKTATKIKAYGENVDTILSVVTSGYNVKISNLTLDGNNIANGIKAETSFAISSINDIIIENVKDGLNIENGTWVSQYENILIRHCENGIKFAGGCTSIFLKNSYVFNCTNIGYYLNGTYSTGVNLCADICGSPYVFNYGDWYITSLGNESSECEKVLSIENSNVIIDNVRIHLSNPSNSIIYESVNGNLKIKNLAISGNKNILKLYEFGYGPCNIEIEQINLLSSAGISKDINHLENRQPCYYKEGDVLFRHRTLSDGTNVRIPHLIGNGSSDYNIVLCDNKPYIIDGYDHQWLNAMPKGTLHLCTEFNNKGTIGFVRCDDNENALYRNSTYLPIATIIHGVTDDRPTADLITGQCYFDKTLGKPIWYNGTKWVDSMGTVV